MQLVQAALTHAHLAGEMFNSSCNAGLRGEGGGSQRHRGRLAPWLPWTPVGAGYLLSGTELLRSGNERERQQPELRAWISVSLSAAVTQSGLLSYS